MSFSYSSFIHLFYKFTTYDPTDSIVNLYMSYIEIDKRYERE
jgi:hypothetical protein